SRAWAKLARAPRRAPRLRVQGQAVRMSAGTVGIIIAAPLLRRAGSADVPRNHAIDGFAGIDRSVLAAVVRRLRIVAPTTAQPAVGRCRRRPEIFLRSR